MKELNNQMLMGFRVTVQMANSDPKTPEQMVSILNFQDSLYIYYMQLSASNSLIHCL